MYLSLFFFVAHWDLDSRGLISFVTKRAAWELERELGHNLLH